MVQKKYNTNGKGQLVGWSVVLLMWTGCGVGLSCLQKQEKGNSEVVNTAENMIEWISWDVENGKLDSTIADTYVMNLEEIINTVRCENCDEID